MIRTVTLILLLFLSVPMAGIANNEVDTVLRTKQSEIDQRGKIKL